MFVQQEREQRNIEFMLGTVSATLKLSKYISFYPFTNLPLPEPSLSLGIHSLSLVVCVQIWVQTHTEELLSSTQSAAEPQTESVTLTGQVLTASASPKIPVMLQLQQLWSTTQRKHLTVQKSKLNSKESGAWTAEQPLPAVLRERCQNNIRTGMESFLNSNSIKSRVRTIPKGLLTVPERIQRNLKWVAPLWNEVLQTLYSLHPKALLTVGIWREQNPCGERPWHLKHEPRQLSLLCYCF